LFSFSSFRMKDGQQAVGPTTVPAGARRKSVFGFVVRVAYLLLLLCLGCLPCSLLLLLLLLFVCRRVSRFFLLLLGRRTDGQTNASAENRERPSVVRQSSRRFVFSEKMRANEEKAICSADEENQRHRGLDSAGHAVARKSERGFSSSFCLASLPLLVACAGERGRDTEKRPSTVIHL